jgi:aspartate-semialdehyde dehydrogenase
MAVHLELDTEYSVVEVERLLSEIPGIELSAVPTAVSPVANREEVFVGRLRQESDEPAELKFWIVADNVRFGVARNVIDIAKILEKSYI